MVEERNYIFDDEKKPPEPPKPTKPLPREVLETFTIEKKDKNKKRN